MALESPRMTKLTFPGCDVKIESRVKPEVVVQVGFMEWTGNNKLRHPRLIGVRTDKDARDVVRE